MKNDGYALMPMSVGVNPISDTNSPWTLEGDSQDNLERNALRIVGWVLGSPETKPLKP